MIKALFSLILLINGSCSSEPVIPPSEPVIPPSEEEWQCATTFDSTSAENDCSFNEIKLHGKVQFVDAFPDIKIQYVDAFPDIRVQFVDAFPDDCGEWKEVDAFPDFKVQVVDAFPDIEVQKVNSFPGME